MFRLRPDEDIEPMRRYLYILLFGIVLVAPFVLRAVMLTGQASAASEGDAFRLIVVTPHNQDIRREFARAFSEWHERTYRQAVEIDYRVPGGTNDIKRQLENTYRGHRDAGGALRPDSYIGIDVVWGGGDYFFDNELKPLGVLQPLRLDPRTLAAAFPQPTLAGVKLYDHAIDPATGAVLPPRWVGVCLSSFGIVYNADLLDTLGLTYPQSWDDLADPRLAGMLALADPLRSGSAAVAFNMVLQRAMADAEAEFVGQERLARLATVDFDDLATREDLAEVAALRREHEALKREYEAALAQGWKRGMGRLLLIAANARYFTDSASHVPQDVGNGQAAAGMAIDFYGRVLEEAVGPRRCKFVSPRAATAITPDPVAVLHGVSGERLRIATRFVEFLLTPEGQRLWILRPGSEGGPASRALRRPPIRRDLYDGPRHQWTDDVNPFAEAGGFNARPEWAATLTETRMIWGAAWMDSRSSLTSAYHQIQDVRDPAARAQLLERLSNLPIKRQDVEQLRKVRKEIDAERVEEWKAAQRIGWAKKFRDHYRAVERMAALAAAEGS